MPWWANLFWDIIKLVLEKMGYFKPPENRPEVILDRVDHDRLKDEDYLIAKNISSKTALNIELSSLNFIIKMPFNFSKDNFKLIFEFTKIHNLDPQQEKRIDCSVYVIEKDGSKVLSNSAKKLYFSSVFNEKYARADTHLLFEYNDSSGRKYITHFSIGKSGILTKGVYLIRNSKMINKMFKRYGIIYTDNGQQVLRK